MKYGLLTALAVLALTFPVARAQETKKPSAPPAVAIVKSFRLVQEKEGPAVEILSTKPLIPAIQYIENPPRLVIDLPNAILEARIKRFNIQADQINVLRGDQFQSNPAVTRIVVDLQARRSYTWDAAGNRLVVHLGKNPSAPNETPFQPATVATITPAPEPVVASVRTSGPLAIAQNTLSPGAAVAAGAETAVLTLTRGGEVYVCPGTSVSVTPSQNGHNVMIGMNRGTIEAHFTTDATSDSVLTPDFRIVFPGPGEFHYAVSADSRGNTCVRALPGNTASAIVSELMGDRTYQVKATDQLEFRSGRLDQVDRSVPPECGCPLPRQSAAQAVNHVPEVRATQSPASPALPAEAPRGNNAIPPAPNTSDSGVPPQETHVQVSAPLVFHATGPPPAPVEDARALPLDSRTENAPPVSAPLPPELQAVKKSTPTSTTKPPKQRSFFQKLGGFFGAIFR